MHNQRIVDITVGLLMLAGIIALLFLALNVSGLTTLWHREGYPVQATFSNVGDLKEKAPVRISGVRVGYVADIKLNTTTYRANVTLMINNDQKLPDDTSASIYTEGLLGSNYISLSPGYSKQMLKPGQKITDTHSALILENLIGQLMYKIGGKS